MTEAFAATTELIAQSLDELTEAQSLWGRDDPPPGRCCVKLREASQTLQRAVSKIIILTGEANRLAVEHAKARGERCCAICFEFIHESRMERHVIEATSQKGKEAGRTSTWWTCTIPCKET